MIDTANLAASFVGSLDNKSGSGFVNASVVRGPDSAGAFTLRLDGGREVSVVVEEGDAKAAMTPGQNVLINLSDGKMLVPDTAQPTQEQELQQAAGSPQQPVQTPAQPHSGADVFIAGKLSKQIRDGLESPLLRSLPAELIEKIAKERGGIDADVLRALDAVLRNRSLPVDTSSPLQLERLEQWLRLALDNPKLAEDLADRIPVLGAREILDKFMQLQRLGVNFLPNDLLRQLSADLFFLENNIGAGQNAGLNAVNVLGNVLGNTVNSELLSELFAKAFSAAPATLLDLAGRIDSSEINADNVKLPPEEARRLVGELINRLPSQAAGKPELVHDMRQLPSHIAEAAVTPLKEPSRPAAPVVPNRAELPVSIMSNRTEPFTNIMPNKVDSSANIAQNRVNSFTNIVQNKADSFTNFIPNRTEPPASVIPNKTESPGTYIMPNRTNPVNTYIIPNKAESTATVISGRTESSANIIPNRVDSPAAPIMPNRMDSLLEPVREARYPVSQNIYNRIESSPRFNIPAENKNAMFSQIGAAQDTIRSVIDSSARTDNRYAAQVTPQANNTTVLPKPTMDDVVVRQAINNNINTDSKHSAAPQSAQQANNSAISPRPPADEVIVRPAINNNINTDNRHTAAQPAQQANNSVVSPRPTADEVIIRQAINNNVNTDNKYSPAPPAQQANNSSISPKPAKDEVVVRQAINNNINTDSKQTFTNKAINNNSQTDNGQPAPDMLTRAGQRLLANTEKLRSGFQEAFASLDLQSRVFPSDVSGGAESSAVKQSLDALRLETLLNASKALQNIFSIVDELRSVIDIFSDKSRELTDAEKLLARTAENLARQARLTGGEITDRLNDILRELNRMQQQDGSKGDGAMAARQSPAEIMRSAALTAAGGLESLHLLASTARGQELQQQVVALPVKIGEEWTEVQVKIIKERKGKDKKDKKAGDGHVSVYLNVAPSVLGEVTAHLDYHPPTSLKLSFQFGKPEATKWFREQTAVLREALSAAGLPGAALEFHTKRRPVRAQNTDVDANAAESTDNQGVTAAGAVGGAGKVDFKA